MHENLTTICKGLLQSYVRLYSADTGRDKQNKKSKIKPNTCKDKIYDRDDTADWWKIHILPINDVGGHQKSTWKK